MKCSKYLATQIRLRSDFHESPSISWWQSWFSLSLISGAFQPPRSNPGATLSSDSWVAKVSINDGTYRVSPYYFPISFFRRPKSFPFFLKTRIQWREHSVLVGMRRSQKGAKSWNDWRKSQSYLWRLCVHIVT